MNFLRQLMADGFAPHAYCLRGSGVVAIDVVSELLIALAYVLIPVALVAFCVRRRDVRFSWILVLFGSFVLCCGFTHLLSVWTLWHPIYRFEALIKAITACVSLATAVTLWILFPKFLAIPSAAQLQTEIDERTAAEAKVRNLKSELELNVAERIAALSAANRQLSLAEERLRLAHDLAAIGISDEDLETGSTYMDQNCRAAFGVIGLRTPSWEEQLSSVHHEDVDRLRQAITAAYQSDGPGQYEVEVRVWGVDDKVLRHLHKKGLVLFKQTSQSCNPCRFIRTVLDVTDRRKVEHALLRSNAALRQFAFAAAHDLREPLRNIGVSIELLALKYPEIWDEDAHGLIASSVEGTKRINCMVDDLLAYTRVIDLPETNHESCDSGLALNRALENLRSRITESEARIVSAPLPFLPVREIHLTQLFQNLIGNAIKYGKSETSPDIRVEARLDQSAWLFTISDNGVGFDQIYADRIFGVFKRLHNREQYSGNGIGLAICSRIVSHYGGEIWAESQPGVGSVFSFRLPA